MILRLVMPSIPPQPRTCLDAALDYVRRGWSVIPVSGKRPLVLWEQYQQRQPSVSEVRQWWTQWPDANVGVVTGAVSDVVVVDIDSAAAEEDFIARCGDAWPKTPRAKTAKGAHVYFAHPGAHVRTGVRVLPGVDVRGDGGYVVAPPSRHAIGTLYTWAVHPDDAPLAEMPAWLVEMLKQADSPAPAHANEHGTVREGQRNDFLYRRARSLHAKGWTGEAILAALKAENEERCDPPLSPEEVTSIAEHAHEQPDAQGFGVTGTPRAPHGDNGKYHPLEPMDLDEMKTRAPGRTWVWEGYFARGGCYLLAADPGVGKSTLLYPLLHAISQGMPFLGRATAKSPSLVLTEEPVFDVAQRLRTLGYRSGGGIQIHACPRELDQAFIAGLKAYAGDHPGVVIVVDTVSEYAGFEDESGNSEIVKKLGPLKAIARSTDSLVVFVHHNRKNQEGAADGKNVRGGSAFMAMPDLALGLRYTAAGEDSNRRVLRRLRTRYSETPRELLIEWDGKVYNLVVNQASSGTAAYQAKVLQALAAGPLTEKEIKAATKLSRGTVRELLKKLGGGVTRQGAGTKSDPYRYGRPGALAARISDLTRLL
jgi:hypothetical protein